MFVFQTNKKPRGRISETTRTQVFTMVNPLSFIELFFSKDKTEENEYKVGNKRYICYMLGLLALILMSVIFFMWKEMTESSEEKIRQLLINKNYHQAVILCNHLLSEPLKDDSLFRAIATEAMLKDILACGWNDGITTGHFTDARTILANAAEQSKHNPDGLKAIEFLNWITDIEEYFFKADPETPVIIFRDEIQIAYLLTQWHKNKNYIRHLLNEIFPQPYPVAKGQEESIDPAFSQTEFGNEGELTQHRIYTHLDVLQNQKNLYFGVIQDLKKNIQKETDSENPLSVISAIAEFKRKFPGIGGLDMLEADASDYIELFQAIKSEKWSYIPGLLNTLQFQTELFAESADCLLLSHEKLSHTREIFNRKREDMILLSKSKSKVSERSY